MTPSPMEYQDMKYRSTSPNWKLGTASKDHKIKNNVPGPGEYNIQYKIGDGHTHKYREWSNSLSAHDNNLFSGKSYNADPCSYDPNYDIKFMKISYSMTGKPKDTRPKNVPGPGRYEKVLKSSSAPFYSIGKSIKKDNFEKYRLSPGPGNYYNDEYPKSNKSRLFKFGSDAKLKLARSFTPGPGNYDHKEFFGTGGIKPTIRGKNLIRNSSNIKIPGPGEYEPKDSLSKPNTKSFKIKNPSNTVSIYEKKKNLPGPGHYTPEKKGLSNFGSLPKWTMGNKNTNFSVFSRINKIHGNIPAPGNYDVNMSIGEGAPKFSMRRRRDISYDNKVPGPGRYINSENNKRDSSPAWKFGSSARNNFFKSSENSIPAPGDYSPIIKKAGSSIKFSKGSKNNPINNLVPGPGHYHIPCSIVDVPRYMVPNTDFKEEFRYI